MSDAYYLHLTDRLRDLIQDPEAFEDDRLPSERVLAERFHTTRVTLRQALAQLEGEGRIHRSNRRGWFVSPPRLDYDPTRDAGFNDYVKAQGRRPRTEVLLTDTRPHPPAAEALGLPLDRSFHHIRRRRFVDDRAVLCESLWVVPERAPQLLEGDFTGSLWGQLRERWGLTLAHRSLRLYSEAIHAREAEALGVAAGTAGLSVRRTIFDEQRRPVEYDEEHWLHNALCIAVELENSV
ncbi:Putative transcriptional regulator of 2-aminoethylphosphonate degradation operons [Halomonas sp. THAF12]|uniref:UTRA domain-containing protein n=1 Tax=Halomonas sp. THAF12 TaxID=2587849 RepID=UPI00126953D1|nr:UTRA domain-containing protein [Halomonas sp. THAF12]QFT84592.1 Putative transcriptional regulator of 2-aminoethylphosphonate degradation operons [Halomonas sp. THAF12]